MIQRIQTIFLLLGTVLTLIFCFTDFAVLKINNQDYFFSVFGLKAILPEIKNGLSTLPLMLLLIIISTLSFISIFLFKQRKLQMKLCLLNVILLIGSTGLIIFHFFTLKPSEFALRWPVALPLLAIIFIILSYRFIRKDEKLVRSLDRIR